MNRIVLKTNELYRIWNDEEQHFFTSLYRAALFLNPEKPNRFGFEYALKNNRTYKGWNVDIVDGSDITWKYIDLLK